VRPSPCYPNYLGPPDGALAAPPPVEFHEPPPPEPILAGAPSLMFGHQFVPQRQTAPRAPPPPICDLLPPSPAFPGCSPPLPVPKLMLPPPPTGLLLIVAGCLGAVLSEHLSRSDPCDRRRRSGRGRYHPGARAGRASWGLLSGLCARRAAHSVISTRLPASHSRGSPHRDRARRPERADVAVAGDGSPCAFLARERMGRAGGWWASSAR
jgi:hypothetical protein